MLLLPGLQAFAMPPPLVVPTLEPSHTLRLDGHLDEPWWAQAALLDDFYETDPGDRLPPPVRTEVRLATDGHRLLVGIKAFDPAPAAIRSTIARRDDSGDDVDKVTVYLDSMGLRRYAQFFEISAGGSLGDGLFSETSGAADQADTQLGVEDRSPNYRFAGAVKQLPDGWSGELSIPLSSLRYEAGSTRPWTVLVARNYPREQAYYLMSAPIPRTTTCTLCHGQSMTGVSGPDGGLAMQGAVTLTHRRGREDNTPQRSTSASVDLKLPLRADTHADFTWRPDFSQVEIDAPQLAGNSRYARYFPEKRPFFLEGADILEAPLPVLRTRSLAAPDAGLRLTRRGATADGTVIVVRDTATGDVLLPAPGRTDYRLRDERSTATLARGRWNLERASLGAVYSERRYAGLLGRNEVLGVDAAWQPTATDRVDLQQLRSHSTALQAERGVPAAGNASQARWYHRGAALSVDTSVRRIDAGFRADNGFIERAGLWQTAWSIDTYRRPVLGFHEGGLYLSEERHLALMDDSLLLQRRFAGAYVVLPRLTRVWFEPVVQLDQRADLGMALRPTRHWHFGLSSVPSAWWSGLWLEARSGSMLDVAGDRVGSGRSIESWFKLQPLRHVQVQGEHKRQTIRGPDGLRWFSETTARWLVLWHLNADTYLRLIDQRRRLGRDGATVEHELAQTLSLQSRMRMHWLLDAGLTLRRVDNPSMPSREQAREVFIKGTYEFE